MAFNSTLYPGAPAPRDPTQGPAARRAAFAPRAIVAAAAIGLVVAGSPPSARAGDSAAADALFTEAKTLADQKKFAEACPKFEASLRLDKAVGTLMNLADCHENIGKIASAWAEWGEAFDWLTRDNDKRFKYAGKRRDALTPRLPHLSIQVTGASDALSIYRDTTKIDEGAYNSSLPVDPGAHSITVRRGDEVLKEEHIDVAERGSASVSFDLPAIEKSAPPPQKPPPPGQVVMVPSKSPQKTIGFVVGGVGVATILVAAALEVGALTSAGAIDKPESCVNKYCSPKGLDAVNRAGTFADAGQWVGIGGILLTGVGLTMVITAPGPTAAPPPSSPDLPSTRARRSSPRVEAFVAPYIGPQGGGVTLAGRL